MIQIEYVEMKREKKKLPSDYPQMAFRVSEEDKKRITALVEHVHRLANKDSADNDKKIKKNELISAALISGLQTLKKKYGG